MGFQKSISYKNPRHGAPGPIGTSKSIGSKTGYHRLTSLKMSNNLLIHKPAVGIPITILRLPNVESVGVPS